jgi:hypothetical protein
MLPPPPPDPLDAPPPEPDAEPELEVDELATATAPPAPRDVDAPEVLAPLPPHAVSKLTITAMPTLPKARKLLFITRLMPPGSSRRSAHRAVC